MLGRSLKAIPAPPTSPQPKGDSNPDEANPGRAGKPPGLSIELLTGVNGWPDCAATTPFSSQFPSKVCTSFGPADGNAQTRLSANRCRRSKDELPRSPFLGLEGS